MPVLRLRVLTVFSDTPRGEKDVRWMIWSSHWPYSLRFIAVLIAIYFLILFIIKITPLMLMLMLIAVALGTMLAIGLVRRLRRNRRILRGTARRIRQEEGNCHRAVGHRVLDHTDRARRHACYLTRHHRMSGKGQTTWGRKPRRHRNRHALRNREGPMTRRRHHICSDRNSTTSDRSSHRPPARPATISTR